VSFGEVDAVCANLRQGDVVDLSELFYQESDGPQAEAAPCGVALISQTCDIVQASKERCLVAPVIEDAADLIAAARKGRKPLHLYLDNGSTQRLADLERVVSIPKSALVGRQIIDRFVGEASGQEARELGALIARAFARFPFPDGVYPFFNQLRSKAQSKSGTESPFGAVIDLVRDLRVSSDQWPSQGRNLILYVVIPHECLIVDEDADPGWEWARARIVGLRPSESAHSVDLNRVCELLLINLERDPTTVLHLWRLFGERLSSTLLEPGLNAEVSSIEVIVLSDLEMDYWTYKSTESLDLESLSGLR
jgi:hypothetical protein